MKDTSEEEIERLDGEIINARGIPTLGEVVQKEHDDQL